MRSSTALIVVLGLALAGCTPKSEKPADATGASPGAAANASGDPGKPPVDGEATITVPPTAVAGADVAVTWTGPGNGADYIDIVPRGFTDTSGELSYQYVRNSNGSVSVRAPTAPGDYDVRYVLDLLGKKTVKVVAPITVSAAIVTLKAPASAEAGQALEVVWSGPNGPGDYIDIVKAGVTATSGEITYAYTSAGSPAKIEAPSAAGDYQIRYVLEGAGGRTVPAMSALKVTTPKATISAPDRATKGQAFKVDWTGPRSSGDYVDLVKKGQTATSGEIDYFYTGASSSGELTAPAAGDYEIRYVLEAPGGRAILATRAISVR